MHQLSFDDLQLFERLAAMGSLSAVARERDVPVSQISRALARIESSCGTRLVLRSTHGMRLTDEGETFLGYCRKLTGTLEELEGEFSTRDEQISGVVRVAASTVVAQFHLLPSLPALGARYPRLRVELDVDDRTADLVREGIDIALRTAVSLPDAVVARRIGGHGRGLYASPDYLATAGTPRHPDDLQQHRLIANSIVGVLNQWPFVENGRKFIVPVHGHWRTNDTNIAMGMVLQGLGIGRIARSVAEPLVRAGKLTPVLTAFVDPQPIALYAVTAGNRHRLPKIKACIDYWAHWFGQLDDS